MTDGWGLPELRTGTDPPPDLVARRAAVAAIDRGSPGQGLAVSVSRQSTGEVDGVVCAPQQGSVATIVHFHGGGYRLGSADASTGFGTRLAAATSCTVVLPNYRLAPEHPFPAALHDAAAVYSALMARGSGPVVISGDSAGGGLAAALSVAIVRAHIEPPLGMVLFSPWVDLQAKAASFATRAASDLLFSRTAAAEAAAAYLQGVSDQEPLASPVFADLAGLPPTLVFASEDEVLLDDGLALSAALARAGVTVYAHFVAGMQHVWPTLFPDLHESAVALNTTAEFIRDLGARVAKRAQPG